jgi:hypothetical protein
MRSVLPLLAAVVAASSPAVAIEHVPVSPFRSVELRGGGEVTVRRGPLQRVTIVEGSSQFTRIYLDPQRKLRIDACDSRCPQRYRLKIDIQSPTAPDVAISGGGAIRSGGGFAPQRTLSAAVHGGGTIDVRSVQVADVSAAVHGGGQIFVRPLSSLSAAVLGGGQVRYAGNPQVSRAVQGGGQVSRMN